MRYLYFFAFVLMTWACSSKVQNPEIQKLENRQNLLKQTTKLNNLKLDLEKELVKVNDYTIKVEAANDKAAKSAKTAKSLSEDIKANPGDLKLASKMNRASKKAASDAKSASQLNDKLGKSNAKVKSLQKEIAKVESTLAELEKRIDFVPNTKE
ncbi:hypothetical protein Pedsa_3452 [Pseudopedobacter saltans DSM 12145]|uniref:SlyB protein n=1 Tax=Pseudopedobacter saltans (strain ATCC 51119 / DSM 12145 / JCM 21818 / CCUG 39354 / LMG 10337 / NBRC 100064 / NCIMB 13643) TaxID=762903 RepID=F0SE64_PSESL|nr:hypothetical protein [Pseudopedobacter saltans]ADY53986.1 hypothetical protein Pedsa_3452 [Pseudopedobacter saltans DSM 12145]